MDKSSHVIFICEVIDLPLTGHFLRTDFHFILCPIKSTMYVDCLGKKKKIFPNWIWSSPKTTSIEICRILHLEELLSLHQNKNTKTNTSSFSHIYKDKGKQRQRQTKVLAHWRQTQTQAKTKTNKTILYILKSKNKDQHRQIQGQTKALLTYSQ